MKWLLSAVICLILYFIPMRGFPQGSWNPPGANPGFPRTIIDSMDIPLVRDRLLEPDISPLYVAVWQYANSAVPTGNSTDSERIYRAMIAKESAFSLLIDRKPSGSTIVSLSQAERDQLLATAKNLLENINTVVEVNSGFTFYNPWQHRSKELITYLIAYDLLLGAGVQASQLTISKDKLITFTANLYTRAMATYLFVLKFFTYQFNNHSIMTASALGLAAIVFNDYTNTNTNYQPQNWINAGLYNLDNTLWVENGTYPRVSEGDTLAGYAESPAYFKYAFENAFPFIRAMGNFLPDGNYSATFNSTTRNIPNPWFDTRYNRLYDWMNKIRMPDGTCPAIHDSQIGFGTTIMALSGNPSFNLPNPTFTPNDLFIRTQYIASGVPVGTISDSTFQALPMAGSLIFRSSWDTDAIYMHFIGKHGIALTGAKAHHQGDASSFSLSAYGQLMAIDPGYASSTQSSLTNKAVDHSLILVNGAGPLPPTGESVSTSTNTAYIENYFDIHDLDYGEVRVDYSGANIIRKNLFVRNTYFLLSDFVTSSSTNNYTFQLHGNGLFGASPASANGAFVPDFSHAKGTYDRSSVKMLAQVLALNNASGYSYTLDSMALSSVSFRSYSRMLASKNQVANTVFLSTLFPYTTEVPGVQPIFQGATVTASKISSGDFRDIGYCTQSGSFVTIPADSTGMNKATSGNAKINFYSETLNGQFSSAFIQYGDSIKINDQAIILTDKKMDVAFEKIDGYLFGGYVSENALVKFYSAKPLQALQGLVTSVSYDSIRHLASVNFSGKGNFLLGTSDLAWVWTGASTTNWNNAQNWHMAGHPEIHGIPAATNDVTIPTGAIRMPVISASNAASCNNLTIEPLAILIIIPGNVLTVNGNLTLLNE